MEVSLKPPENFGLFDENNYLLLLFFPSVYAKDKIKIRRFL